MNRRSYRRRRRRARRGMTLYVAVAGTTAIVSALALASMAVVRLERAQARAVQSRLVARAHARSAVQLALKALANNANWRSTYANNVETAALSLGFNSTGTLSWKLLDSDGSLANADVRLTLKGIGRVGSTVQASSLQVQAGPTGPQVLRSQTGTASVTNADVKNDKWYAQFFKAQLPADANGWRVSSVELYCKRINNGHNYTVRLYRTTPLAANEIESVTLPSNGAPSSFNWYAIAMASTNWLDRDQSVVLTVESTASIVPICIQYLSGGVSESDSSLMFGNPVWQSSSASQALRFRINGYYTTGGNVTPVAASWTWDTP